MFQLTVRPLCAGYFFHQNVGNHICEVANLKTFFMISTHSSIDLKLIIASDNPEGIIELHDFKMNLCVSHAYHATVTGCFCQLKFDLCQYP